MYDKHHIIFTCLQGESTLYTKISHLEFSCPKCAQCIDLLAQCIVPSYYISKFSHHSSVLRSKFWTVMLSDISSLLYPTLSVSQSHRDAPLLTTSQRRPTNSVESSQRWRALLLQIQKPFVTSLAKPLFVTSDFQQVIA